MFFFNNFLQKTWSIFIFCNNIKSLAVDLRLEFLVILQDWLHRCIWIIAKLADTWNKELLTVNILLIIINFCIKRISKVIKTPHCCILRVFFLFFNNLWLFCLNFPFNLSYIFINHFFHLLLFLLIFFKHLSSEFILSNFCFSFSISLRNFLENRNIPAWT